MKYVIISVFIMFIVIDVLVLYCAMCSGAEEDRWIEKNMRKINYKRKK